MGVIRFHTHTHTHAHARTRLYGTGRLFSWGCHIEKGRNYASKGRAKEVGGKVFFASFGLSCMHIVACFSRTMYRSIIHQGRSTCGGAGPRYFPFALVFLIMIS
ncbi:unnamed protein product [Ectocarpus sp. 8 AP-2014]